jgi:type IX secretion system PorP/SprF family membrane protein
MKKRLYYLILICTLTGTFRAQQDAMFTHYMHNTLWLNPAYAGTRDALTVTGIHRAQWVGFDGAPEVQSLTMHSPILKGKMGMGLSVLNDKIGPTQSTIFALDLQYQVKLSPKSKLAFGIKGLVDVYKNNVSRLTLNNPGDVAFAQNYQLVLPNAGTGIYYHRERFYAGISTPKLMENIGNGTLQINEKRHYFFIMGTVVPLTKTIKFKPTCFFKATVGSPVQGDVTGSFMFNDRFSLGAMYRTGDAAGALLTYNFNEQCTFGYSFDWSMANTTGKYNSGSHEIMLRYDLISKSKSKIKSPRYF